VSFATVAYRTAGYETPLWAFPNLSNGRYNRAGTAPTQYLSLHPMTPWAELLRSLNQRTTAEARTMRVEIWAIRITLEADPVEITFETAPDFGLAAEDLVADDHGPCRAAAAGMYGAGIRSFFAPSAALPGTTNLIVLEPAVVTDYHVDPFDPDDWPTAMVAQNGRCPEGLVDHVHYKHLTTDHPSLVAWRAGNTYEFEQPDVTAASLATV
jgi:RES domain-containing protein